MPVVIDHVDLIDTRPPDPDTRPTTSTHAPRGRRAHVPADVVAIMRRAAQRAARVSAD